MKWDTWKYHFIAAFVIGSIVLFILWASSWEWSALRDWGTKPVSQMKISDIIWLIMIFTLFNVKVTDK